MNDNQPATLEQIDSPAPIANITVNEKTVLVFKIDDKRPRTQQSMDDLKSLLTEKFRPAKILILRGIDFQGAVHVEASDAEAG